MFLIYINDIGDGVKSQIRLFADDSLLYGVVNGDEDAKALQEDLDRLVKWSDKWQMTFNINKCRTLRVRRSKTPTINHYTIRGSPLKSTSHHPYLGVELSSTLNWDEHISNIVGKANRTLGFIRRNLGGCPEDIKSRAYTTLVRPQLEYGSCVWDPHTQKHISDIEGVQRRAARFVKNCHKREPATVTQLLEDLNWCSLEHRRKVA